MLTPKQQNVLRFVQDFFQEKGYSPSYQEIANAFDLASRSTAQKYIEKLKKGGYLEMNPHAKRGISLQRSGIHIPLLGKVAAGLPIEYLIHQTNIEVPSSFVKEGNDYFCLEVVGDSMINDGILEGDHVIIRRQNSAAQGSTVVATVDDSSTLKKIFYQEKQIELRAANPKYSPLVITSSMNFRIDGVLTGVLRLVA